MTSRRFFAHLFIVLGGCGTSASTSQGAPVVEHDIEREQGSGSEVSVVGRNQGPLVCVEAYLGSDTTHTYVGGKLVEQRSETLHRVYEYEGENLVRVRTLQSPSDETGVATFLWRDGRVREVVANDARYLLEYDSSGGLIAVRGALNADLTYDAEHRAASVTLVNQGESTAVSYQYDGEGRLTGCETVNNGDRFQAHYTYDERGLRTGMNIEGQVPVVLRTSLRYDSLSRLIELDTAGMRQTFRYDEGLVVERCGALPTLPGMPPVLEDWIMFRLY